MTSKFRVLRKVVTRNSKQSKIMYDIYLVLMRERLIHKMQFQVLDDNVVANHLS